MSRGLLALGVLLVAGSLLPLPLLVTYPGPTFNTLGELDGKPMITITGHDTYPTSGNLDMTTVSERGASTSGVHLGAALVGWVSPRSAVVPRETYYPPDATPEQINTVNDQLFAASESDSVAAALDELDIPTTDWVVVSLVGSGTPADGILHAGDVVESVDGQEVSEPAQVGELVRDSGVGSTVEMVVLRAEDGVSDDAPVAQRQRLTVRMVTAANPAEASELHGAPYLGIAVGTWHEPPFDITFAVADIGGPSAGLMFSLAIVDMLTEGAMTGGGHVAGTGSIDPEGTVGPIGGIQHKLLGARDAGAELFLAPAENCDEVLGHIPDGLTVVPVATLAQARRVVQSWAADPATVFPGCAPS